MEICNIERRNGASHLPVTPNRNGSYEDHVMAYKALPSPEVLRQLLRYEPETGNFYWMQRDASLFPANVRTSEHDAAIWNNRYSGRQTFLSVLRNGYLAGQVFKQKLLAHRVAWAVHYGAWPVGPIDHINRVRNDNRIANLRVVSAAENSANRSSPIGKVDAEVGVFSAANGRFKAAISTGGKSRYLGTFANKHDARSAYLAAQAEYIEVTQDKLGI